MDGRPCWDANCPNRARAFKAMRALRVWRMKQADQYWLHHYVKRLEVFRDDPRSVDELIREARSEGAPPHILERMQTIATETNQRA
jgi:hypothetical protein